MGQNSATRAAAGFMEQSGVKTKGRKEISWVSCSVLSVWSPNSAPWRNPTKLCTGCVSAFLVYFPVGNDVGYHRGERHRTIPAKIPAQTAYEDLTLEFAVCGNNGGVRSHMRTGLRGKFPAIREFTGKKSQFSHHSRPAGGITSGLSDAYWNFGRIVSREFLVA
jgi:hypothetical protein